MVNLIQCQNLHKVCVLWNESLWQERFGTVLSAKSSVLWQQSFSILIFTKYRRGKITHVIYEDTNYPESLRLIQPPAVSYIADYYGQ